MNHVLVATFISVAIPYVLIVLDADVLLPARYSVTPLNGLTVTLPDP